MILYEVYTVGGGVLVRMERLRATYLNEKAALTFAYHVSALEKIQLVVRERSVDATSEASGPETKGP